ncbi:hypothetical protein PBI_KAMPE_91 [Gordonia phage Kampe]|uniref:Uncharacterized protein n=3 Tax=Gordonia phage Orchid TaxID=1838075 RepID=A0A160DHM2_9CAUD|nr:hypothetical protein BH761_gp090 [Gordonia phage Orchid]ANA87325.1 hypothetical protein PBI_PATRICKSTAR_91 [Gordonia phage PatrickStar]ANA87436.1 hypothetical protein PBI_ORCHID_90 [Gordonia phage Orchid]ANA87551.1 hypothetical protein PBI_KAMPE_91 [Gordonia phage Kampe]
MITIDQITIVHPENAPSRIHMMVIDGIDLIKEPKPIELGDWFIQFYSENAISFYSPTQVYEVDSGLLGSRTGADLIGPYMNTPAAEWMDAANCPSRPHEIGEFEQYEGAFNSSNIYSQPVYPVTVFTPATGPISRDLFMPVLYLNEVILCYGLDYHLTPAVIPAYCGDIVFELRPGRWTGIEQSDYSPDAPSDSST